MNCKELGIEYEKVEAIDLQKSLYDLSVSPIHKSNLKDYAKKHGKKHSCIRLRDNDGII